MLGPRIAALRRGAGWSQAELASRIQVSPSAIGMYEQGRREPSLALLQALCEHFHVSADYLLMGHPEDEPVFTLSEMLTICIAFLIGV